MNFSTSFPIPQNILDTTASALLEVDKDHPAYFDVEEHAYVHECQEALKRFPKAKQLLVLGIGGSALGTISALNALGGKDKVTIIDHIDPEELPKVLEKINWEETLVNVISKSGGTLETMLQFSIIEDILNTKNIQINEHILCTTGKDSMLDKYAQKQGYPTLPVPEKIGGRFSILTPVGIFPLFFAGIDIEELLEGAKKPNKDVIISFVASQYLSYTEEKRNITVFMSYHKKLMSLWDWYRQLLAESIGKNLNTGISPVLAYGSTDQHSQVQLYTEGPQDKLISFLSAPFNKDTKKYPVLGMQGNLGIAQTQEALFKGTKKSLEHHKRPFTELQLLTVDAYNIGQFFMTGMLAISVLGKMLEVNAYDQPGVEEGKIQAKRILENY